VPVNCAQDLSTDHIRYSDGHQRHACGIPVCIASNPSHNKLLECRAKHGYSRRCETLHVGVIANGHGLVLEHDVFYNVRNAVVFWNAEGGTSHRNAMRNCLVYGASTSGIWTVQTDGDDFDFRDNVIANSRVAWMRERGGTRRYKAVASVFAGNANMAAYGAGAAGSFTQTDSNFLSFQEMRLAGEVDLVMDRGERDYLHIRKGSAGSEVGAGLFTNK
jgi:hypothetical protein